jgi:hypothetical protein
VFKQNPIKRMPAACLVIAAALLLAAPAAQAMKLKSQNLTQLISESQSIVFGTVTRVTDGIEANGRPYTEVTLAVGDIAKGNVEEGSDFTFRQFGLLKPRSLGNGKTLLAVTPEGFARWNEGETVLAFMYRPASRTGLQTTAGMAQGKFTLANGTFANEFNNAGLFEGVEINSALLSPEQQNMLTTPGAVDANEFADLVGRAVAGEWIENGEMK